MKKLSLGLDTIVNTGVLSIRSWSIIFDCNGNTQETTLSKTIRSLRNQKMVGDKTMLKKGGQRIIDIQGKLTAMKNDDNDFDILLLPEQVSAGAVDLADRVRPNEYVESTFRINIYQWLNGGSV